MAMFSIIIAVRHRKCVFSASEPSSSAESTEMPFRPEAIANWIIDRAERSSVGDLTHLKLQKLVYFSHGWHSGITGQSLVSTQVEAWKHGPVFPDLYHNCMGFGRSVISDKIEIFDSRDGTLLAPQIPEFSEGTLEILEAVWDEVTQDFALQNLSEFPT